MTLVTSEPVPSPVLVLGGQRSGKSAFAESLVARSGLEPVYIATGEPGDAEMAARIARHRARRGPGWRTIEAPLDLAPAIAGECRRGRAVLVDCLTLWLSNLLAVGREPRSAFAGLERVVAEASGLLVLVSNEVGLGVVPANALARQFVDLAGELHERLARCCPTVVLTVAGLPLALKGSLPPTFED